MGAGAVRVQVLLLFKVTCELLDSRDPDVHCSGLGFMFWDVEFGD